MNFASKFEETNHIHWSELLDKTISMIRNSPDYLYIEKLRIKKRRKNFTGKHQRRLLEMLEE